jgi:hypothetical protein
MISLGIRTYVIGGLVVSLLTLGWYALRQHDRAVARAAVIEVYQERVDSLKTVADSSYAARLASDSAKDARITQLEEEVAAHEETTDSLVRIELPQVREDVDTLLAVLRDHADPALLPVVDALSEAIEGERSTSAAIFQSQVGQIAALNAQIQTLRTDLTEANQVITDEHTARIAVEEQLVRALEAANKGDFLTDKVIPFAAGAAAILVVDKIFD